MGSGKTTIAKIISKKLLLSHIEIDDLILRKSKNKSINEIFAQEGESKFRKMEIDAINEIVKSKKTIISTGGGIIMNKINIDRLKATGYVIFLKTSFIEAKKRLEGTNDRPLFKNIKKAEKLYKLREPLYEAYSDKIVQTDDKNVNDVCNEIIKLVK